tara:strand:- start:3335 stop:5131 length:1797 start_codon:yes stop_codon:yes gene_type:complete
VVLIIRDFFRFLKIFQSFIGNGIYLSFFLTIIAGLAEGFGITLLLPIFQNISGSKEVINFGISHQVMNSLSSLGLTNSYERILILITLAFFTKGLFIFITFTYNSFLKGNLLKILKIKMFSGYSTMNYKYFLNNNIGELSNILNEQTNLSIRGFNNLYTVGLRAINCVIYLVFACSLAGVTGAYAIIGAFIILFLFRWLNKATKKISIKTAKANGKISQLSIESLQAFKYLKSTNQFNIYKKIINKETINLSKYQIQTGVYEAITSASREPISIFIIMIILLIQITFISKPIDSLLVALILFYRALISTLGVQGSWQRTQEYVGSLEVVINKIKNLYNNQEINGSKKIKNFNDSIEISDLFFKFSQNSKYLIKNLNIKIKAKQSIAFVGQSGSGKTTIANILCLLLEPSKGEILIDGIKTSEIDKNSWRNQIGYVSQETTIFNCTIAENISLMFGYSQNKDLFPQIKKVASKANIDSFIESLPMGYKTIVGEQGIKLSGGQKQRIFIARELYRKPKILILDEATSALDTISELAIQKSIDSLRGKITIIIIAHRISTIRNSDYLYVIDKGEIIEKGTFDSLSLKKDTFFNKLISSQKI